MPPSTTLGYGRYDMGDILITHMAGTFKTKYPSESGGIDTLIDELQSVEAKLYQFEETHIVGFDDQKCVSKKWW
jgi:hypothetical protein